MGAPIKPYEELGTRRKQQIRKQVVDNLRPHVRSEEDIQMVLEDFNATNEEAKVEDQLIQNAKKILQLRAKKVPLKYIESLITKNLPREARLKITNTSPNMLKKRRSRGLKKKMRKQIEVSAKVKVKLLNYSLYSDFNYQRFNEYILDISPVKSGTLNRKICQYATYKDCHFAYKV